MTGTGRILVVGDGDSTVATALRSEGFEVTRALPHEAVRALDGLGHDLVVLAAGGLEHARALRGKQPGLPIIFLSERDATEDKVAGLAVVDDYVTKPFSVAEIGARVRALLRRARDADRGVLRFADLVLDERTREVWRAGEPVELTPREFALLRLFLLNRRRVLTKAQILHDVWHDLAGDPRVVETYVSYLRRKLDRSGPSVIQTIRLVGYALREPDAPGGSSPPDASS